MGAPQAGGIEGARATRQTAPPIHRKETGQTKELETRSTGGRAGGPEPKSSRPEAGTAEKEARQPTRLGSLLAFLQPCSLLQASNPLRHRGTGDHKVSVHGDGAECCVRADHWQ